MTDNLKPCPFCGGEAEPFNPFGETDWTWTVLCGECAASVGFEQTEAEAIAAWNARAEHGTLTAEQVREAVMSADRWEKPMGNTGLTNTHLIIRDDGWQAIADELNAALGVVECKMVTSGTPCDGNTDKACTACGAYNIGEFYNEQSHRAVPNFCPNCGAKVVG